MILQADNKEKLNKKDIDSVNSTQLNISGLSVSYSDSTVLENVTLQLKKGEILGIAGESGSGKSTLIKAIIGLLPKEGYIDGGVIEYNGVDITGNEKCLKSLRGSNIGMIFQNTERAMCPVRTIKSQLYESIFSNEAVKDKRKAKRIIDEKAVHMLEQMNIHRRQVEQPVQQLIRLHHEVVFRVSRYFHTSLMQAIFSVTLAQRVYFQRIFHGNRVEDGLQVMVTVRSFFCNIQSQVYFSIRKSKHR